MTTAAQAAGLPLRGRAFADFQQGIIRLLALLALALLAVLVQGCSAAKIVYNQAPELAHWYLDGHFDLTGAQSLQVKADLTQLHAWHRQTQLPAYIETLQKLQQQLPQDIDAAAACTVFADASRKLAAVTDRAEPIAMVLVASLSASQLTVLEQKFSKNNADEREDLQDGTAQSRREKRFKKAVSRAEMLYGRLGDKQLAVIGQRLDQSRFEAERSFTEKMRRQKDTVTTLRTLVAAQSPPDKVQAALRGLLERSLASPQPAYRDYAQALVQDNCQSFAALHNSTTAAQRQKAVETLGRYEQDFRVLVAQKS